MVRSRFSAKLIKTVFLAVVSLFFLYPILYIFGASFMMPQEVTERIIAVKTGKSSQYISFDFIPDIFSIRQYKRILLNQATYLSMFWNSLKIVLPLVIGQVAVGSMAAYVFAKLKFPHREKIFFLYIITMLMPFQVTLVPNYLVMDYLGLLDNPLSLILPGIFSAFGVFLLRQFMTYIPDSCIDAARIDGAGLVRIFFYIVFPMVKHGIAALVILTFIEYWNMIEQLLLFLSDVQKQPLSTYLPVIGENDLEIAFAASFIYMLPVLLLFLYLEEDLVRGIQYSDIQ